MLITCPSCAAGYDVPGPLAPGRAVRCARCGNQWAPVAKPAAMPAPIPAPPPAPPPAIIADPVRAPAPAFEPVARPAAAAPLAPRRPPTPGRAKLLAAWLASLLVLAALAGAAFLEREAVMGAWPPSIRAYTALGLAPHP